MKAPCFFVVFLNKKRNDVSSFPPSAAKSKATGDVIVVETKLSLGITTPDLSSLGRSLLEIVIPLKCHEFFNTWHLSKYSEICIACK